MFQTTRSQTPFRQLFAPIAFVPLVIIVAVKMMSCAPIHVYSTSHDNLKRCPQCSGIACMTTYNQRILYFLRLLVGLVDAAVVTTGLESVSVLVSILFARLRAVEAVADDSLKDNLRFRPVLWGLLDPFDRI